MCKTNKVAVVSRLGLKGGTRAAAGEVLRRLGRNQTKNEENGGGKMVMHFAILNMPFLTTM